LIITAGANYRMVKNLEEENAALLKDVAELAGSVATYKTLHMERHHIVEGTVAVIVKAIEDAIYEQTKGRILL